MYSRPVKTVIPPYLWEELSGDGYVFEPAETSVLLEAQELATQLIDTGGQTIVVARAAVANAIVRLARQFKEDKIDLEAQFIAAAALDELLVNRTTDFRRADQ